MFLKVQYNWGVIMRASFEEVDYYCGVIYKLTKSVSDFSQTWRNYLESVGWTEDEYSVESDKEIFSNPKIN